MPYNRPLRGRCMNSSVLRLLDANFNRAREALRVMEDCARFVLNDKRLSAELKQLRHEYTSVIAKYVGSALLHRDSPGDLRIHQPTEAEFRRADIADVITAAGKRVGEALRTIED